MTDTQYNFSILEYFKIYPERLLICAALIILLIALIHYKNRSEKIYAKSLEEAKNKAEIANKEKTSFLFTMSHDIRTPMNAIIGFTNMAKNNLDNKEKLSDCLGKIQQASELLLQLINSSLEMNKIEMGKTELDEKPGSIECLFKNVNTIMQELADKKNIKLSFEYGSIADHYVYYDRERTMRVLINLISNSIKYTQNGGQIKVRCEQIERKDDDHGLYRYTIKDNGIGMSEDFQKHLFEVFSQEKSDASAGVQGYGIGLSVVKSFVELMNGTIEFKSEQGQGTIFYVTLPFRIQKNMYKEYAAVDRNERQQCNYDFSGKRILLVDDDEFNREVSAFILEEENISVEEAYDGCMAAAMVKEKGPDYYDMVLMDIQMPVMDGYEATRQIRKMFPEVKIPIIAVSANAFAEDKAASLEAGMNDHITKPINISELFSVLEKYINQAA